MNLSRKKPFVSEKIELHISDEDGSSDKQSNSEDASSEAEENESGEDEASDKQSNSEEASSGAEGDESDEGSGEGDKTKKNAGWADAMRKILNTKKPKKKKTIVLSKAKKLNEIVPSPKEEVIPFEIEGENGVVKEGIKKEVKTNDVSKKSIEQKKHKSKDSLGIRVKPSVLDREREKRLQKIATNGVVQLFNAVRQQQKEIENRLVEAGPLERKREKALKNIDRKAFLDVLMGGTNKLTVDADSKELKDEDEDEVKSTSNIKRDNKVWSVLRDDFIMGAKLKDWNKQDTDEDSSAPEEMDSD